ncbi:MAG: YceI family protein [Acidimicrobiales bacterium]
MAAARFRLDPERSQVWIEGSSSVHPIHASATGLAGWVAIELDGGDVAASPNVEGEVRIEVDRLRSGNPLVDAETRRRIDARRHPEIVGTVTGSKRLAADRAKLRGTIAFRGEVQEVIGELAVAVVDGKVHLAGQERFDVRAWGLQPPRLGLVRVHPEVTVRLDAWGRPDPQP